MTADLERRSDACLHVPIRACLNLIAPMWRCTTHHAPWLPERQRELIDIRAVACDCDQSRFGSEFCHGSESVVLQPPKAIRLLVFSTAEGGAGLVYVLTIVCDPSSPLPHCSAIKGEGCLCMPLTIGIRNVVLRWTPPYRLELLCHHRNAQFR